MLAAVRGIVAATCAAAACPGCSVRLPEASRAGGAAPGRVAALALCDYGTISSTNPAFVASHFDWVVTGGDASIVVTLHGLNPAIRVLFYHNMLLTAVSDSPKYTEDMYMHDPVLGTRLVLGAPGPGQYYLMDPASSSWRSYSQTKIVSALGAGYDGAHVDDVWGDLADPTRTHIEPDGAPPYTGTPSWYSVSQFQAGVTGYLTQLTATTHPKTLVYNGIYPQGSNALVYLSSTDGAVQEGWVYDNRYGANYRTGADWANFVSDVLAAPAGKRVGIISYGNADDVGARMYALASYLLVERDGWSFSYAPSCTQLAYPPEWNEDIGSPAQTVTALGDLTLLAGQVYVRTFSKGIVLVNPANTEAPAVTLPRAYALVVATGGNVTDLGGSGSVALTETQTVTLPAHSGAILLNSAPVGGLAAAPSIGGGQREPSAGVWIGVALAGGALLFAAGAALQRLRARHASRD